MRDLKGRLILPAQLQAGKHGWFEQDEWPAPSDVEVIRDHWPNRCMPVPALRKTIRSFPTAQSELSGKQHDRPGVDGAFFAADEPVTEVVGVRIDITGTSCWNSSSSNNAPSVFQASRGQKVCTGQHGHEIGHRWEAIIGFAGLNNGAGPLRRGCRARKGPAVLSFRDGAEVALIGGNLARIEAGVACRLS